MVRFGFIAMTNDGEAQAAITALNGAEVGGRALIVSEARPKVCGFGGRGFGGGQSRGGGRDSNRRSGGGGRGGSRW